MKRKTGNGPEECARPYKYFSLVRSSIRDNYQAQSITLRYYKCRSNRARKRRKVRASVGNKEIQKGGIITVADARHKIERPSIHRA
jgi:hypothetical protein